MVRNPELVVLFVRMPRHVRAKIKRTARASGMTMSTYVRLVLEFAGPIEAPTTNAVGRDDDSRPDPAGRTL